MLITCGAVQRELKCVSMRCGAACGQGLQTQRSMRMHFLLSTPSLQQNISELEKRADCTVA